MRAVGLLLYGNLRFGRNKEFRRSLQTAENLNNVSCTEISRISVLFFSRFLVSAAILS